MKTTRFLLSLLASSLLLVGCGDDGKSPKIKSFAASSTSLPEGGADVTFTWSVKREKTVELLPFPGLVTGTTATVNVTEPTTFTLLAKNGDGSARKRLSIAIGEPMAVSGQVVDYRGEPVPNVQVFVDETFLVTDANGLFSLDGVVPPYDVGLLATGGVTFGAGTLRVSLYRGVTRPDPKLLYPLGSIQTRQGNVTGTVTGGVGFPYPTPTPNPGYATDVTVSGPAIGYMGTNVSGVDGAFDLDVYWSGEPTAPITLNVLQYSQTPEISYTGYGRTTGTATDQVSVDLDVAMSAVGTGQITGTVSAPFDITGYNGIGGWVDLGTPALAPPGALLGGPPMEYSERIFLSGVNTTNGNFSFPYPEIGGGLTLSASVSGLDGLAYLIRGGFEGGETGVELEMPAIPVLLTPVNNASASAATVFSVSPVEGAVYRYAFQSAGGGFPAFGVPAPTPDVFIEVFSSSNATSFPDADLLPGVDLDGRSFEWFTYAYVGYGNVDGLVENAQVPPSGEFALSAQDDSRTFTYGQPLPPF